MNRALLRTPGAIIPLLMSAVALASVIWHLLTAGQTPATGEGTSAHVFQLMFAGQAPVVAFFAMKWLPREPSGALFVMAMQAAAALVALAPVIIFDL